MIETPALLVAWSATKTTRMVATRPFGIGAPVSAGTAEDSAPAGGRRIAAVVAVVRTATAARTARTARGPNPAITTVASGGPATHANETIARVRTTSEAAAPVCLRWANSSELPTPAGPPSATSAHTATG